MEKIRNFRLTTKLHCVFVCFLLGVKFKRNIDEIFGPAGIGSDEFEIEEIGEPAHFAILSLIYSQSSN